MGSEQALFIAQYANEVQRKSKRPLMELYSVVHAYCLSLTVAILNNQAETMRKRQKAAVMLRKVEYVKDPLSLTIKYWQPKQASEGVESAVDKGFLLPSYTLMSRLLFILWNFI